MSFFQTISTRVEAINSLLCVGLDPHASQCSSVEEAETFCIKIINATSDYAVCYKPNAAFFEAFGPEGMSCLLRIVCILNDACIPVIYDAKRGDISTTAEAYKVAAYDVLGADAITLAPYMGRDSITPFLNDIKKGCFVLCKTSNPSSSELQSVYLDGEERVFERVARLADGWNTNDNVGLVVGATDIEALLAVRKVVPNMWILAPGLGAQGGNLEAAVQAGISADGSGLLLPVSRGISRADNPRQAALELRDAINVARKKGQVSSNSSVETNKLGNVHEFIAFAVSCSVLKFGTFTLKSGRISPYFFNAGLFHSGKTLRALGRYYAKRIFASKLDFDILFGPAYKGITLAASISIAFADLYDRDVPYTYNRKEVKDHGEGGVLVGADLVGKRVLIVDDVITAGTAIGEAMGMLTDAVPVGVCIALDRQEKVGDTKKSAVQAVSEKYNLQVISIASLNQLEEYLTEGAQTEEDRQQLMRVKAYRADFGVLNY